MNIDFHNKVVVITGGCSGIGLAAVKMMTAAGAAVVVLDTNNDGSSILSRIEGRIKFILCNVAVSQQVDEAFIAIGKEFGGVDVLVNNAGIQSYGSITETTEEEWDKTMNVNLKSVFLCSKFCVPLMLGRKSPVIVNVASVKSFVCQDKEAAYVTSKTAILGLTRAIAADYSPKLRCVAVCPGAIRTPLLTDELDKLANKEQVTRDTENIHLVKRIGDPEEVAAFILFLASDFAGFATGQAYRVDGGIGVRIEGA